MKHTATLVLGFAFVASLGCGGGGTSSPPPQPSSNPTPTTFTLTVQKSGNGVGTVTSSPSGISCGSACSATFNSGTSVTLSAQPDANSVFSGWSGACSGTGSCSFSITQNATVTAAFDKKSAEPTLQWSRQITFQGMRAAGLETVSLAANNEIAVGGFKDNDGVHVAIAMGYDSDGNQKWLADYGAQPSKFWASQKHPSENKVFLAGEQFESAFLAILSQTGQIQKEISCPFDSAVRDSAIVGDQLYLAVTRFPKTDPSVLTADLSGNINCQESLVVRNEGRLTGLSVSANHLWAAGDFTNTTGMFNGAAYLRKFDKSGNPLTSEIVFDDVHTPRVVETVEGGQSFVYLAGNQLIHAVGSEFLLVKLDQNGNEIWRRTWNGDTTRTEHVSSMYDLVAAPNGGVVLVGAVTKLQTTDLNDTNVGAIAYAPNGDTAWKLRHSVTGRGTAFSATFDAEGKLYVVGMLFPNALILKFNVP
jgi:hypothetical protein